MTSIAPNNINADASVDNDETDVAAVIDTIDTSDVHDVFDLDDDNEHLPPPELPANYLDNDRESLSESKIYSDHLSEHWGF